MELTRTAFICGARALAGRLQRFLGYLLACQALTSVAALRGYAQYVLGSSRRWR